MTLSSKLKPYRLALNDALGNFVEDNMPGPDQLNIMLKYHLGWVDENGVPVTERVFGKQIRPLLVLLAAEIAGGDWHQALPAAVAVELLHNFSLIHDDIEDGSSLRRGRPTLWCLWGKAQAINAGDTMFAMSYKALSWLASFGVSPGAINDAVDLFSDTNLALTRGQHLDIAFEQIETVPVDNYIDMIGGKSASLIAASMALGAAIVNNPDVDVQLYWETGYQLGLAFQIRDDILGIWGDTGEMGKSAVSDVVSRKKSLPVLHALEQSAELRQIYGRAWVDGDFQEVMRLLEECGSKSFAVDFEQACYERVVENAEGVLDVGVGGEMFVDLVIWLMGRSF